jgi:HD domain
MNMPELQRLKDWFSRYCSSFSTSVEEDQRNIVLKEEHTHKVCANARLIAQDLSLGGRETLLAEIVALLHDVGRFPQYRKYKTFRDSISENHAVLGAKVLLEQGVLRDFPKREQDLIVRAVTLHNVLTVPEGLDDDMLLFVKLIRDADKLDIWRVFQEYYEMDEERRPGAAGLGLPDAPGYSPEVAACLLRGEIVQLVLLRTLNDFKLLQLSWIYDLNFTGSFSMVKERRYVDALGSTLPKSEEISKALQALREFVDQRVREKAG